MRNDKLFSIFIESYGDSIRSGYSIKEWVDQMQDLGIIFEPQLKNMMLAAIGIPTVKNKKLVKKKGYVAIRTSVFGDVYFPDELALKTLTLGFLP